MEDFRILRTYELTDNDWYMINDGFKKSFDREITVDRLKAFYKSSTLGYSYHSIGYEGGRIIGFTTIFPMRYLKEETEILLGLSCSSFVLKEYRSDIFILKDLYDAIRKYCLKEGLIAFHGVPNKNSYQYSIKFLKSKEIIKLPYYFLPIRVSKILKKKNLFFLNPLSILFSYTHTILNLIFSFLFRYKENFAEYRMKKDDEFCNNRFSRSNYKFYKSGKIKAWYKLATEDGINTVYIMDFAENGEKTNFALSRLIWHILINEKADIILFVGLLRLMQFSLIKLPKRLEPKELPFTYNLLDITNKEEYKSMSSKKSWDFSILNLDVR